MKDILMDLMKFVGWQIKRFMEKDSAGWRGMDAIYEHEYRKRAIRNLTEGDYVDACNLLFLAAWAKARGKGGDRPYPLKGGSDERRRNDRSRSIDCH